MLNSANVETLTVTHPWSALGAYANQPCKVDLEEKPVKPTCSGKHNYHRVVLFFSLLFDRRQRLALHCRSIQTGSTK